MSLRRSDRGWITGARRRSNLLVWVVWSICVCLIASSNLTSTNTSTLVLRGPNLAPYYDVALPALRDAALRASFVQSELDEGTKQYLLTSKEQRRWWKDFLFGLLTSRLAGWSKTDANGLLRRGGMFVASPDQLARLVRSDLQAHTSESEQDLLDIGSGDGAVTAIIGDVLRARSVVAVETSPNMRDRLRARTGFRAVDSLEHLVGSFRVVSLMNVLDRADEPMSLLKRAKELASSHVLVAVVLPFCPSVEDRGGAWRAQREPLTHLHDSCAAGKSTPHWFEDSVLSMVKVFQELDLRVVRWTRLPYLSSGDARRDYFVLSDAVFWLEKRP